MLAPLSLAAVALPALVSAYPYRSVARSTSGSYCDSSSVDGQTFDYVIAGGGLTGLVVASRLTEDPNINVLVIEGGQNDSENPGVYDARNYGDVFGTRSVPI